MEESDEASTLVICCGGGPEQKILCDSKQQKLLFQIYVRPEANEEAAESESVASTGTARLTLPASDSESVAATGIARLTIPASDSSSDKADATGFACLITIEASDSVVSDPEELLWELSGSTGIAFLTMAGDPELL